MNAEQQRETASADGRIASRPRNTRATRRYFARGTTKGGRGGGGGEGERKTTGECTRAFAVLLRRRDGWFSFLRLEFAARASFHLRAL